MKKITSLIVVMLLMVAGSLVAQTTTITIKTSAECGTCKKKIEHDLPFEKGVQSVNLNLDNKVVTVVYNAAKTNPDKIRKAIAHMGYDADDIPADKKAYDKLEECCKKDGHKD